MVKPLFFLYLFILACCSSCYEIVEEISLTKNGSGTMKIVINGSESKTKIAAMMLMDSIKGFKVPSKQDIQDKLAETKQHLKAIKGVSDVSTAMDFNNYIAVLKISFTDVSAINTGMVYILNEYKLNGYSIPTYLFNKNAQSFEKKFTYTRATMQNYMKLKPAVRDIIQDGRYTSVYRFDQTVKKFSNTNARLAQNKKAIMQRFSLGAFAQGKVNISNNIQLSN